MDLGVFRQRQSASIRQPEEVLDRSELVAQLVLVGGRRVLARALRRGKQREPGVGMPPKEHTIGFPLAPKVLPTRRDGVEELLLGRSALPEGPLTFPIAHGGWVLGSNGAEK